MGFNNVGGVATSHAGGHKTRPYGLESRIVNWLREISLFFVKKIYKIWIIVICIYI